MDLGRLLEGSGAILRGHFVLSSGRHSDVYFEKFRLIEQPEVLTALCGEIAKHFSSPPSCGQEGGDQGEGGDSEFGPQTGSISTPLTPSPYPQEEGEAGVDFVAGPLTGGIIIAFECARQMGVQAVYVESENGQKTLRRGKVLPPGARVLVVDDVLTTGLSVFETIKAIQTAGGEVVGVGLLIDRSEKPLDFGCPFYAAYKVEAQSFPPDEVPAWLEKIPVRKPGTRK